MSLYAADAASKADILRSAGRAKILAVETSCDETAVAIVEDGRRVLSSEIASQIGVHAEYGGVVPEIASREHVGAIDCLVDRAYERAGVTPNDIDAVAVTRGPGLVGALLTGVSWAKAYAWSLGLPLIPVNHIEGHVCANYIAFDDCDPPFVCLIASGGHTALVSVGEDRAIEVLGETLDDSAGEALDKVARILGYPYPGGPRLDEAAEAGDDSAFAFPKPKVEGRYDFSFSGLKTSAVSLLDRMARRGEEVRVRDFAASFRKAVIGALVEKAMACASDRGSRGLALAGGVAANRLLRAETGRACSDAGIRLWVPPPPLCTDNAAMIGGAAFYGLLRGDIADMSLNAEPSLSLRARFPNVP